MLKILFFLLIFNFLLFANRAILRDNRKIMSSEKRTALVIGNRNYDHFSTLKNPINDASAIGDILQKKKFDVILLLDASREVMDEAIDRFSDKLKQGGIALFYYAGHGLQVEGRNYLVPVEVKIEKASKVKYRTVSTDYIVDIMGKSSSRLNIIILDACRNDPFSRSTSGGLAPINAAKGTFIAYATSPGKVAQDGAGKHGVFTKNLIEQIQKPLEIGRLFRKVRQNVDEETNGEQIPWTSSSMVGDFFFTMPIATSEYSFSNTKPSRYKVNISTIPKDAKVQIMNSKQKYHDGMALKDGKYTIKVTSEGYHDKIGEIVLKSDIDINISLQKKKVQQLSSFSNNPSISSNQARFINVLRNRGSYIEPAMIKITRGSFIMGSDDEDYGIPQHRVLINKEYYIGKTEVTFSEYDKFCKSTKRKKPNDNGWGRGDRPVINVSYNDAIAYAKWLSKKSKKKYRLPTEIEWEYATRAGSMTNFNWGDEVGVNRANCDGCGSKWDNVQTAPVGSFAPNKWGLYDTHGNVSEWCSDWFSNAQTYKVLRGGSWFDYKNILYSSFRSRNYQNISNKNYGFRLVGVIP